MATLREEIQAQITALETQAKADAFAMATKVAELRTHLAGTGGLSAWLSTEVTALNAEVKKIWDSLFHRTAVVVTPIQSPVVINPTSVPTIVTPIVDPAPVQVPVPVPDPGPPKV